MKKTGYIVFYKLPMALGFALFLLHLLSVAATAMETGEKGSHTTPTYFKGNKASWSNAGVARNLFALTADEHGGGGSSTVNRIRKIDCTKYIQVFQVPIAPPRKGIPTTYGVQVFNGCVSAIATCNISNIHLSCGSFSTTRPLSPHTFRRVSFDDCLINDGGPMNPGQTIGFQYTSIVPYPLSVTSAHC